jgi:hypothetical protein
MRCMILIAGLSLTLVVPLRVLRAGDAPQPAVVPFELLPSRHMAVQVKINGKGPYRLVFDTGAPLMLVTTRAAKDAGIVKRDAKAPGFGLFNMMGEPKSIELFEMGELQAKDVAAVVMDHPTVKVMEELFGRLDGIVGFPFFARYRMTIDYQAKTMSFVPTNYSPKDVFDALMKLMTADPKARNSPKVLAPLAQWGIVVDKPNGDEAAGVVVQRVFMGGPSAVAGLQQGDRILTVDGRWTDSVVDFYEALAVLQPGKTVTLRIDRAGQAISVKVTPRAGL